jgi:hypothetical protein
VIAGEEKILMAEDNSAHIPLGSKKAAAMATWALTKVAALP